MKEAFDIAQAHVACCGDIPAAYRNEASKFLLLGQGDHSEVIFSDAKHGELMDGTRPLPPNGCDSIADFFVGRAVEVQAVFAAFVEGARLVSLVGKPKIGKTQVALRACEYAARRYTFRRMFFFSFSTMTQKTQYGQFNPPNSVRIAFSLHRVVQFLSLDCAL